MKEMTYAAPRDVRWARREQANPQRGTPRKWQPAVPRAHSKKGRKRNEKANEGRGNRALRHARDRGDPAHRIRGREGHGAVGRHPQRDDEEAGAKAKADFHAQGGCDRHGQREQEGGVFQREAEGRVHLQERKDHGAQGGHDEDHRKEQGGPEEEGVLRADRRDSRPEGDAV